MSARGSFGEPLISRARLEALSIRRHAVKVLRDAAGRIDASDAVRWLRAEAARLEQQNANHENGSK